MTKNIEKKFPERLSFNALIERRAKPIKDMTYFKLEINGRAGIYKPLNEDENGKITEYVLRNVFTEGKINKIEVKK